MNHPTIEEQVKQIHTPTPRPRYWAAYAGTAAGGDGITLHTTELEALQECTRALGLELMTDQVHPRYLDEEELREALEEECSSSSSDWCVMEVLAPCGVQEVEG